MALPGGRQDGKLSGAQPDFGQQRRRPDDGGIPDIDADALLASPGSRGVVVKAGHVEAAPDQEIYLVRFEDANGVLGPPVGCLPEELIQQE
ncbi:MAG TPA: nitrogen fixation protein NifZ [Rhodocyclaceae bacterium]|nr:nitrogen fixation protein NifZ [Rhodocyclaceae bacterium]